MTEVTVAACNGSCCAAFYLPFDHDEINDPSRMQNVVEGWKIAAMVLPIGLDEAAERTEAFGGRWTLVSEEDTERTGHYYTCRNWDHGTRRCVQYAARPGMCSKYPYGGTCKHCGATA